MSQYGIKGFSKGLEALATPIHDGSNGQGYGPTVENFVVQAIGETFFGDETVTNETDGLRIQAGETIDMEALYSRGTHEHWDLTQIYYVGGPWTLILMRKV